MAMALVTALIPCIGQRSAQAQTLEAIASLPADTYAEGPTSGQFIAPANGRLPPFTSKQPIQGISSVLKAANGDYLVMSDNGFGAQDNSQDYVLRVYRIAPDFRSAAGGTGTVGVRSFITLRDPGKKIAFPIVADGPFYPGSAPAIAVDPVIRRERLLTGADFDIESFREAHDGTFWFGDEFGPFLIHTDRSGRVLEAPIPMPGVMSPQNQLRGTSAPNLGRSKGFEGMAISPNGKTLYPMLEGALTTDPDQHRLIISEFDIAGRRYTGRQWSYRLDQDTTRHAIGDMTAVNKSLFLIIERDNLEGAAAQFKKVFLVDLDDVDGSGYLVKREVADLLMIRDPLRLGGSAPIFRFPFTTIESVIPLGQRRLGVLNDNNYPFSSGRVVGQPDPNEFIVIRLDAPLSRDPVENGDNTETDWAHSHR